MPFLEPANVRKNTALPLVDAAMAEVQRLEGGASCGKLRIGKEKTDIAVKAALIAFQGQDIIGLLGHDRGGNLFLSPHRV